MKETTKFGYFVISIVTILQVVAWLVGYNGTVFALTSLIIGGVTGAILGIKLNINDFMRRDNNGNK